MEVLRELFYCYHRYVHVDPYNRPGAPVLMAGYNKQAKENNQKLSQNFLQILTLWGRSLFQAMYMIVQ